MFKKPLSVFLPTFLLLSIFISINAYAQTADFLSNEFWKTASVADVESAIQDGADVKARNKKEMTPLMIASAQNSNPGIIETLIKHGADINARTKEGFTSLMYASGNNSSPKVIDALIKHGADINARNKDGRTVLDYAKKNDKLYPLETYKKIEELMAK